MNHRRQRVWVVFLSAAAIAFAALALLTWNAHRMTQRQNASTAEAQRQEDLRTALYRMEQRIAPQLARVLGRTENPSALQESLHLSLELRTGETQTLAQPCAVPALLSERALTALAEDLELDAPLEQTRWIVDNGTLGPNLDQVAARGASRSNYEWAQRRNLQNELNIVTNQSVPGSAEEELRIGPVFVAWDVDEPEQVTPAHVVLARALSLGELAAVQSIWIGWPALEELLLGEVDDLFEGARLEPVGWSEFEDAQSGGASALDGDLLTTIPARLSVPPVQNVAGEDSALRLTIISTWALALAAFAAATLAFRASQRDAARQRRFTSAVTHELRTPLTTFRMYSEMLAREMVPAERRTEYLRVLEDESRRLGALVENVLAHARLDDGRAQLRRESLTVRTLIQRAETPLRRRCEEAGAALSIELGDAGDLDVSTDPEAMALVLANLVDNACKYGAPPGGHSPDQPIRLTAEGSERGVYINVCDQGEGVREEAAGLVFRPFERAGRDESDAAPGVGLGLALARDLARSVGGDLALQREAGADGASFRLTLPRG